MGTRAATTCTNAPQTTTCNNTTTTTTSTTRSGSLRDALRTLTAAAASSSSAVVVESISTLPSVTSTAATPPPATSSCRYAPMTRTSHRASPTSTPRTAPPYVHHPHASAAAVAPDSDDALLLPLHATRLTSMSRRSLVGADPPAASLHAFAPSTQLTTSAEPIVISIEYAADDDAAGEVVASDERSTTEDEEGASLQPTRTSMTLGGRDPTHLNAHGHSLRKRVKLSRDSQEPHQPAQQHHRASSGRRHRGRSRTARPIHNAATVTSNGIGSSEEDDNQPSHVSSAMELYRHRAAVLQLLRRGRSRSLSGLVRRSRIKRRVMQRVIEHMVSDETLQETAMTLHASGDGRTVRGGVVGRRRIFYSIIDSNAHNDGVGRWQVRRSNSKSTRTCQPRASAIRTAAVTGLPSAPITPPANVDASSCGVKRPRCHLQLLGSDNSSSDDPSSGSSDESDSSSSSPSRVRPSDHRRY
jgi:hypothetical protein